MAAEVDPGADKNADFYHGRKVAYSFLCQASKALHNLVERAGALESERKSARRPQDRESPTDA